MFETDVRLVKKRHIGKQEEHGLGEVVFTFLYYIYSVVMLMWCNIGYTVFH